MKSEMQKFMDELAANIVEHLDRMERDDPRRVEIVASVLMNTLGAEGFVKLQKIVVP